MRIRPRLALTLTVLALVLTACAGRSTTASPPAPAPPVPVAETPTEPPTPATEATPAPQAPAVTAEPARFAPLETLRDVHFGPSGTEVVRADIHLLDVVAGWLKENPTTLLRIEGYTDELGPRELNVRLGERRATSVMKSLVTRGIQPDRITTTSYGPDGAVCAEKTESCRAKNRRVRFLVTGR